MTEGVSSLRRRGVAGWAAVVFALTLAGCDARIEVFRTVDVQAANEIEAVLRQRGIGVARARDKDAVVLSVANAEFPGAASALRDAGLPRQPRRALGDAFTRKGLLPTPLEERARYVHGLEAAIESAILDIDGVVSVRARVVPPERLSPGVPLLPASASLLVKHRPDVDLTGLVPGLVQLVKNGVPGLADEDDRRVAVVLVKAREPRSVAAPGVPAAVRHLSWVGWAGAGFFTLGGGALLAWQLRRRLRRAREGKSDDRRTA